MRVLVFGAYGMLGHRLLRDLGTDHVVAGTCRRIRDDVPESLVRKGSLIEGVEAADISSVSDAVSSFRPDVAVNCIGIVKQSPLAKDPIASITINSLLPHQMASICQEEGSRLVHMSTDCVYSGRKGGYIVSDLPDAEDLYGRSKAMGEPEGAGVVTVRSSIIGRELGGRYGLVEWLASQNGKRVKGFEEAYFSGFTTREMANVVRHVIMRADAAGTWHAAAKRISKRDLIVMIKEEMGLDIDIVPDRQTRIDRSLDGAAFNREFDYRPPSWKRMIKEMKEDWQLYCQMHEEAIT